MGQAIQVREGQYYAKVFDGPGCGMLWEPFTGLEVLERTLKRDEILIFWLHSFNMVAPTSRST